MTRRIHMLVLAAWCCAAPAAFAADPPPAAVDAVFAAYDKPDTPGAALAVVRDGRIVYSRGYGMANLEYAVRNTPSTVFHVASISKQFTAFAILLLAQDGKLSLDDDVRKHVPELQVQGPPITLRHLLHHTSGLRDQWSLLQLAGLRLDDGITDNDILGLLWQQRQLNFTPGEEELYSNSGYSLLSLVVRRASGKTLAAFAQERIFGPLGMKNTHVHDNYGVLVQGRAYSYYRVRDGYRYVALSYSNTGATSVFTTAEDLALWSNNFDDMRVGGAAVAQGMLAKGKLNSGREITYASGVVVRPYRGIAAVEHAGSDAGFRSNLLRFAQPRLAVIVLGNAAELDASGLSRKVADLYLEGTPGLQLQRAYPPEVELQARDLSAYLGDYEVRPGGVISVGAEGNKLFLQSPGNSRNVLAAASGSVFFSRQFDGVLTFPQTVGNERATTAVWKVNDMELVLRRVADVPATAESARACVGDYYSEELRTLYTLSLRGDRLVARYPRGVFELRPINRDLYAGPWPSGTFFLKRNAQGACESFGVSTPRVRNLQFVRTSLAPAANPGK